MTCTTNRTKSPLHIPNLHSKRKDTLRFQKAFWVAFAVFLVVHILQKKEKNPCSVLDGDLQAKCWRLFVFFLFAPLDTLLAFARSSEGRVFFLWLGVGWFNLVFFCDLAIYLVFACDLQSLLAGRRGS